ncbi:phosphoglucosamine mutase [Marinobacter sp.]|mgnify:FL=1|jgi:phosphoglucosamine mutase|uniref:phosphoglucosamine mutase n=1 Tax=Marinobacter sp. TaxID=50741 RepID=UPI000C0C67A9|nr:phosphoglucosamine mutase [Marinobacter sp.]MBE95424.1 phosphoglucosamine mutase [Marinobacter sp.]MBP53716.1 phosphoglucosamine mutase [Marinobacter sp.]PHQ75067.1 MAG: phosphoglucosamine mutase [Marinobacter sp.]|tara:strand:+ start:427 stop:1770 length:1344 start_codon:yes stop_codon:yes gene_type:complete
MSDRKYFGTDGIRGRVGEFPITPEFMLRLGWAAGQAFKRDGQRNSVLIGKDTRLSGYMFESALEAGLSAAGVDVKLLGPMPTPAIAYLTRTFRASAGIVISASHNPHHDNGIKFFSPAGTKLDDALETEIEKWLDRPIEVCGSKELGKASRVDDAPGRYVEFCKSTVPNEFSLEGLHIVLDCAHGATYHVAPKVFRELGAKISVVGGEPDGLNINLDVGSTHMESLSRAVLEKQADLGIAFDGDGDRVLMVDRDGSEVDGDELLYVIAAQRHAAGTLKGGVVGTLMTNLGVELALREQGIDFERAKVGDRYVMERLIDRGWLLGGEGSGHMVIRDCTSTGDGIVSALQVLLAIRRAGSSLADLRQGMSKLPQKMINVRVDQRFDPLGRDDIVRAVESAEARLGGGGRVLLRASGTEPLIRVMAEGQDEAQIVKIAEELAVVVENSRA